MNLNEIIPTVTIDNVYIFRNIFFKYFLNVEIEEKFLQIYRLSDGETLEDVSYQLYNDTVFFWVFMIINNFTDPLFDVAIPDSAIQRQARDMSIVDGVLDEGLYFTTYDELSEANDLKRNIKVIKPEFLNKFLTQLIVKYNEET